VAPTKGDKLLSTLLGLLVGPSRHSEHFWLCSPAGHLQNDGRKNDIRTGQLQGGHYCPLRGPKAFMMRVGWLDGALVMRSRL
jgi:hypothetical protein